MNEPSANLANLASVSSASGLRRAMAGTEPFHAAGTPLPFSVRDFWAWGTSDLVSNALRGVVAEFLVHRALGCPSSCRTEWDAVDLVTPEGVRVEVKCSGFVQSWQQKRPSAPSFDIAPKRSWHAETNTYETEATRPAQVYVFSLHHHAERSTVDPLDVTQWSFYVVATSRLNEVMPLRRRIGLNALSRLAGAPVTFDRLAARVSDVFSGS